MVLAGVVTGGFLVAASASFVIMSSPSAAHSTADGILRVAAAAASGNAALPSTSQVVRWIDDSGNALSDETTDMARAAMTGYLSENMMPYDIPIARTLGFPPALSTGASPIIGTTRSLASSRVALDSFPVVDPTPAAKVDGLSDGILNSTIYFSLLAKELYPWTDLIPKSIYMEYVVPYAVVNEPRVDHRPLIFHKLRDPLQKYERSPDDTATKTHVLLVGDMQEAVQVINTRLWSLLGKRDRGGHSQPIIFQAGQTPRIYDPLSVVAYGHSSCTGLSILLISALRAVGIPARMAGTPAWHGNVDEGNHSWVEVYVPSTSDDGGKGGQWKFLEPSPGIKEGDTETTNADDLDRDPKTRWFCTPDRFDGSTKVYVTRFVRGGGEYLATHYYPMAWSDPDTDMGVPGEDRTAYYVSICGAIPTPPAPSSLV